MSALAQSSYWHRQYAPLSVVLYALAVMFLGLGWIWRDTPGLAVVLPLAGVFNLVLATAFHHLTVADEGDRLAVQFGPLPLFRTAIRYDEMLAVQPGRTTILDGWGIHLRLRGGWVWNLWGRDCVEVQTKRGMLRIGTDDAANLARFLKAKIDDIRQWEQG